MNIKVGDKVRTVEDHKCGKIVDISTNSFGKKLYVVELGDGSTRTLTYSGFLYIVGWSRWVDDEDVEAVENEVDERCEYTGINLSELEGR